MELLCNLFRSNRVDIQPRSVFEYPPDYDDTSETMAQSFLSDEQLLHINPIFTRQYLLNLIRANNYRIRPQLISAVQELESRSPSYYHNWSNDPDLSFKIFYIKLNLFFNFLTKLLKVVKVLLRYWIIMKYTFNMIWELLFNSRCQVEHSENDNLARKKISSRLRYATSHILFFYRSI